MREINADSELVYLVGGIMDSWLKAATALAEFKDENGEEWSGTEMESKLTALVSTLNDARELALATFGLSTIENLELEG